MFSNKILMKICKFEVKIKVLVQNGPKLKFHDIKFFPRFCAKKFAMRDFPFLRLGQRVNRQNTETPDEEQSDHQNGDSHDAPEPNFASDDDFPVGDFAPPDDDDDDIPAHFPDETFNEDNATPMDTNGLPQPGMIMILVWPNFDVQGVNILF